MSDLEFIAFSDDGDFIILQNAAGEWIEVAIKKDGTPKTAVTPIERIENLSPREIQFRIRAGLNPEELAAQTGTELSRIMIFAPPVLQERAYVAQKASNTIIRKASGTGPLIDVVLARLSPLSVDVQMLEWDSARREDGRWNISLTYPSKEGERKASWLYDARNSALVPSDEEARWLMGESTPKSPTPTATQPTEFIRVEQTPRLKVVPSTPVEEEVITETEISTSDQQPTDPQLGKSLTQDVENIETEEIGLVNKPTPKPGATLFDTLTEDEDESEGVQRPKLPSWDEILFGSRKKD
ncbi:MAG: hypothetical protein RL228_737 [Actinomycetota bacterium]